MQKAQEAKTNNRNRRAHVDRSPLPGTWLAPYQSRQPRSRPMITTMTCGLHLTAHAPSRDHGELSPWLDRGRRPPHMGPVQIMDHDHQTHRLGQALGEPVPSPGMSTRPQGTVMPASAPISPTTAARGCQRLPRLIAALHQITTEDPSPQQCDPLQENHSSAAQQDGARTGRSAPLRCRELATQGARILAMAPSEVGRMASVSYAS